MPKPKLHQLHQSDATSGQAPLWDPDAMDGLGEWAAGDVVKGLTSADSSVTITDNGDGTLDLAAAGGGGGGGGAFIGARVYNSANISVTTSSDTLLPFNSERFDTDSIHSTSSNTSRLTCQTAGKYAISATVLFAGAGSGARGIQVRLNGSTVIAIQRVPTAGSGDGTGLTISTVYDLAVGDYVELTAWQTSGANLNVLAGAAYSPEFMMYKVG